MTNDKGCTHLAAALCILMLCIPQSLSGPCDRFCCWAGLSQYIAAHLGLCPASCQAFSIVSAGRLILCSCRAGGKPRQRSARRRGVLSWRIIGSRLLEGPRWRGRPGVRGRRHRCGGLRERGDLDRVRRQQRAVWRGSANVLTDPAKARLAASNSRKSDGTLQYQRCAW